MAANVELKERNYSINALDIFKAKINENAELNKLQDELIEIQTTFFKKKVSEEVKNEFLKKLQEITDLLFKQFAQTESNKGKIRKDNINKLLHSVLMKYQKNKTEKGKTEFGKMVNDKISRLITYIEKVESITSEEEETITNVVNNLMKNNAGEKYTANDLQKKNQELQETKESLENAKKEISIKGESLNKLSKEKDELTKKRVNNLKAATNITKNLLLKGYTKAELEKYSKKLSELISDMPNNKKSELKAQIEGLLQEKQDTITQLRSKKFNSLSLTELANIIPHEYKNKYEPKEKNAIEGFLLAGKRNRKFVDKIEEIKKEYDKKKKDKVQDPQKYDYFKNMYKNDDFAKKIALAYIYDRTRVFKTYS